MGKSHKTRKCPRCGSRDVLLQHIYDDGVNLYICSDCDHDFEVGGSHRRNGQPWRERHDEKDEELEGHEFDR